MLQVLLTIPKLKLLKTLIKWCIKISLFDHWNANWSFWGLKLFYQQFVHIPSIIRKAVLSDEIGKVGNTE